ncbi:hypothetical protein [Pigmentibacter ruber]|uniref:hypothetical protein n=1 Tax=Pigmentibacter ruber TaxID=2683196 RepID=UPI00131BC95D|nr:hypothetical protein [Pigmentibacter ruber]
MFIIKKIKQFLTCINILFNKPKSSPCIIYGCESIYKKKTIEIISTVTTPLYLEAGKYYINFYRIFLVIIDFINISLKEKKKNKMDTYSLALKTALLSQTVKTYNPKVIFTFLDNDIIFQNTALNMKGIKFFCIQNGARGFYDIKTVTNLKLINFFCFGLYDIKFLSDNGYYANRWLPVGNLLTSYFIKNVQQDFKKKYHICLISQWRKSFYQDNYNCIYQSYRKSIDGLVLSLNKFRLLNKNLKICIALCSYDFEEYDFYNNIFSENCIIYKRDNNYEWTSYEAIAMSHITVSVSSSMLSEAIALQSTPLGYNSSGDPFCNASLPESFICKNEGEFIDKLNYYLSPENKNNSLEKYIYGNGDNLSKIYAFEVIQTAVKIAVEESSQNFEDYLNKFSIKPTDLCELKL